LTALKKTGGVTVALTVADEKELDRSGQRGKESTVDRLNILDIDL
jgi:hypothetical protein